MGNSSKENRLNDLTPAEWLKFTKTWFIHRPPPRKKNEILHPAKYPEDLIEEFIRFFTKKGEVVLDPFLGTGSTLVACQQSGRQGIGIELQPKYAEIARTRVPASQRIIQGNAADISRYDLPEIDFLITSPPYGPMLTKSGLVSKDRAKKGLDVQYSDDPEDLGNAKSYEEFLQRLVNILVAIKPKLKSKKYAVVILQNYMDQGNYRTLAWDVGKELSKHFQFRGERLWCQDHKTLYPYGYRYSFVPNVHHHYCLIFRKE
ncbi:site-specific DNA-methyltransferase [Candidatus Woesearchaeota archaeon]|nr:site-specific DNA-methyltransferase [Candidatus Woesearchaeota archaeon]